MLDSVKLQCTAVDRWRTEGFKACKDDSKLHAEIQGLESQREVKSSLGTTEERAIEKFLSL